MSNNNGEASHNKHHWTPLKQEEKKAPVNALLTCH